MNLDLENEVIEHLKKSLTDIRCIGARVYLREILTGYDKLGKEYSRLTTVDGTEIATVDDLIGAITAEEVELDRVRVGKERFYNSLSGVRVKLKNVLLNIQSGRTGDTKMRVDFGAGVKNPVFVMSYFADNDSDLPIKINYIDAENYVPEENEDESESK